MRRLLIAALLLPALLPVGAAADHDGRWVWLKAHVPVIDRTEMGDYVREKVDEYNALAFGLTLDYVRGDATADCAKKDGAIVVCDAPHFVCNGLLGCTDVWTKITNDGQSKITAARVLLADVPGSPRIGCHELGHAIGLQHWSVDSCLHPLAVPTDSPGAHDAAALRSMY